MANKPLTIRCISYFFENALRTDLNSSRIDLVSFRMNLTSF